MDGPIFILCQCIKNYKCLTFSDKPLPSKVLGTERNKSMLSMEAVLLICCEPLFLKEPTDEGFLLVLGEYSDCECSMAVDQLLLTATPVSDSELDSPYVTAVPPLGLTGLRLFVLDV